MADCCPDSKLSTAANIIGLLTFTLSALNLLIVRVLRNESKIIKQLRKGGWKNSLNALEQKIRYIRLFNPAFAGFGRDNMHPDHASGIPRVPDVGAPGERSDLEEKQPEERFTEILKDVQRCYDQGKVTINETEAIQHLLAEQISLAGYARATRRLILRWDVENFYEASVSVCRQLYNWRESREAVDKLEDNYQELNSIVAHVDSLILVMQGIKLLQLQRTIDRQASTIVDTVNTINTRSPTEPTPSAPPY